MRRLPLLWSAALFSSLSWAVTWAPAAEAPVAAANDKINAEDRRDEEEYYELYKLFVDTLDQVERNYVKEIDRRELIEAAIEGVITKLDPHSSYISPEEIRSFKSSVESQFGGIGIQITVEGGFLKILSPLVGTPAYRAGLQAGDRIVKIGSDLTEGFTIDEAIKRLKGDVGTQVTLTVVHPGSSEEMTVTVERELIEVDTVLGDRRKPDDSWDFLYDADRGIGYIRISAFSRDTVSDVREALEDLTQHGLKGLILDLRFNPGGLLTSAIEISDLFLSKGTIVSTEGRNVPKRTWEASAADSYDGFPMAILVNRYSASASEIVSAALQDHDRAVVIGERTWGKGSVQNVIELSGKQSALKLTTASYQRPSGKNIHRFPDSKDSDEWGVRPNEGYEIRLSNSEMAQLIEDRKKRDIVLPKDPAQDAEESDSEEQDSDQSESETSQFQDRQFQKALEYLTTELARTE